MGRTKYTEAERDQIMIAFIKAAREIIDMEGIEKVSIRKIATLTGMNSATLYLYFPNADVLVTMASMSYLEKYCRTLAADMPSMKTPRQALVHTWDVFAQYAFEYPEIFQHLFYTEHTVPLVQIVDDYYHLFPEQLDNIGGAVREMLHAGSLNERGWQVFNPAAEECGMPEEDAIIANDMLVSYFRSLLEERCKNSNGMLQKEKLIKQLKQALELLIPEGK